MATTGLRKVTDIARTVPMRRSRRKYISMPRPELAMPRKAISTQARVPGGCAGHVAQATGASARLAAARLPVVTTSGSTPAVCLRV